MEKEILLVIALIVIVVVAVIGMPLYFNSRHSGNLQSSTIASTNSSNQNGGVSGQSSNNSEANIHPASSVFTTIPTTVYTTIPSQNSNFEIQTGFYKNSTLGDGSSTVVIPITIFDSKTNEPLTTPIQVQAQANIGSVSSKCSAPSVCNITFQSPTTLKTENASISIDAGGTIKTILIEVMADPPTFLSIIANPKTFFINSSSLYINGGGNQFSGGCFNNGQYNSYGFTYLHPQNFSNITVYVYDKNYNPLLMGIVINFSANMGGFSNSSCIIKTNEGQEQGCSITYKPVTEVSNVIIHASSYAYNISNSTNVNVSSSYVGSCPNG